MVRNVAGDMAELDPEDFYLLSGVEQGMRFSEWVRRDKIPEYANLTREEVDYRIDRCLDQFARKNELEDEDYRGNYLHLNPADAEPRGIETGDMVTVESETGEGELMAHVTETIKPGFVTAEYGFGEGSAQEDYEGMNTMKLHAKQMDPITGQPDRHVAVDVTGGD